MILKSHSAADPARVEVNLFWAPDSTPAHGRFRRARTLVQQNGGATRNGCPHSVHSSAARIGADTDSGTAGAMAGNHGRPGARGLRKVVRQTTAGRQP